MDLKNLITKRTLVFVVVLLAVGVLAVIGIQKAKEIRRLNIIRENIKSATDYKQPPPLALYQTTAEGKKKLITMAYPPGQTPFIYKNIMIYHSGMEEMHCFDFSTNKDRTILVNSNASLGSAIQVVDKTIYISLGHGMGILEGAVYALDYPYDGQARLIIDKNTPQLAAGWVYNAVICYAMGRHWLATRHFDYPYLNDLAFYQFYPETGKIRLLFRKEEGGGGVNFIGFDELDRVIAVSREGWDCVFRELVDEKGESYEEQFHVYSSGSLVRFSLDDPSKVETLLAQNTMPGSFESIKYSREDNKVYIQANVRAENKADIYVFDIDAGTLKRSDLATWKKIKFVDHTQPILVGLVLLNEKSELPKGYEIVEEEVTKEAK